MAAEASGAHVVGSVQSREPVRTTSPVVGFSVLGIMVVPAAFAYARD